MAKLTPEQREQRSRALKAYWERRRAAKRAAETAKVAETVQPDYATMYNEAVKQLTTEVAKNAELEKICKSYAEQANNASNALQKMALEYDARTKYMLDCVKHAYLSIQFAINATDNNKGDK